MNWYTSDLHFGHENVIRFCRRPFTNVEHMEEELVANWNKRVRDADTVYVLGDVFFHKPADAQRILKRLNGRKILVRGNHDKQVGPSIGWDLVVEEMVRRIGGHRVRLSHFPYAYPWWHLRRFFLKGTRRFAEKRPPRRAGELLLHGHSHSPPDQVVRGRMLDVGVDGHRYTPWSEDEVIAKLNKMRDNK